MFGTHITRDFNCSHGDILMSEGDISITENRGAILKSNALHRIITSHGDVKYDKFYGADIQRFIGSPTTKELAIAIQDSIIRSLTDDLFLLKQDISVLNIIDVDKIYFRISIRDSQEFQGTVLTEFTITFNTTSGIFYE